MRIEEIETKIYKLIHESKTLIQIGIVEKYTDLYMKKLYPKPVEFNYINVEEFLHNFHWMALVKGMMFERKRQLKMEE